MTLKITSRKKNSLPNKRGAHKHMKKMVKEIKKISY